MPGLTLRGTVNYNQSRYRAFLAPCYSGQSPAQGCTFDRGGNTVDYAPTNPAATPVAGTFQDLSGVPTAMAPDWTATLGASYDTETAGMKIGGSADGRYSDSYLGSSFGDQFTRQPAYAVLDANVHVAASSGRWEVALIGKNLTNKYYLLGGGTAPLTGTNTGLPTAVRGDALGYGTTPRTVRLQLTVRY